VCPTFEFTTDVPGGQCGRINDRTDGTGKDLDPFPSTCASFSANRGRDCTGDNQCDNDAPCMAGEADCAGACGGEAANQVLECGSLYIGGGRSVQPPSPTPDGALSVFDVSNCDNVRAMVLVAATSADTGDRATCTSPGCFFGPPLPIPNRGAPAVSTCVYNSIAATPAAGGLLDATTGVSSVALPLLSTVYVTGDLDTVRTGVQPCPQCIAGRCTTGANMGGNCTTPTSLATSHDCPPPGQPLSPFGVDLSPLGTRAVSSDDAAGVFCAEMQATPGAFGRGTARYIEVVGRPSGNLTDGGPHAGVLSSVFCIPSSGDVTVDTIANLPGPGAVTLTGDAQLVPSPDGAFLEVSAGFFDAGNP
jgi:hypothetical protein